MMRIKNLSTRIGAVCITSLYPQFNGSHFSQQPSSISTKWLHWVAKSCERWRMRTGLICGKQMREQQSCFNKKRKENGSCVKPLKQLPFFLYTFDENDFWAPWINWWKLCGKKIIHEVGVKRPSKLLHCTRFLYKLFFFANMFYKDGQIANRS